MPFCMHVSIRGWVFISHTPIRIQTHRKTLILETHVRPDKKKEVIMERTRNIRKELQILREEVMRCFRKNRPAKEFGATLMVAMVGLHMTEARIRKTRNLKERRLLIHEFNSRRDTIKKGLSALGSSKSRAHEASELGHRRAVSGMR